MLRAKILSLLILLVALISCGKDQGATLGTGRVYLEEVVPPCVPTLSEPDPCPVGMPIHTNTSSSSLSYMESVPTFLERLVTDDESLLFVPHIVIRGTMLTGTTRCDRYPDIVPDYLNLELLPYGFFYCFIDVEVKEYVIGEGPKIMPVIMYRNNLLGYISERGYIDDEGKLTQDGILFLDKKKEDTILKYEGKEMVLFLSIPFTLGVEAWGTIGGGDRWFVQQTDDGIRAVAQNIWLARNDEMRSKLNLPLDELVEGIKKASPQRVRITDGRIGIDPDLPMLVTDVHELRDFYTRVGAVYEGESATVLPPPVPGEDDPAPPTIPVNEGTSGSSVPLPGEETNTPSSTDDAGTTTTSTSVSTTTTTTTSVAESATTTTITATTEIPTDTTTTTSTVGGGEGDPVVDDESSPEGGTTATTNLPADDREESDKVTTTMLGGEDVPSSGNDEPEDSQDGSQSK